MIDAATVGLMMFPAVIAGLMFGFPVAFTLSGVALVFVFFGWMSGAVPLAMMSALPSRLFGIMTNNVYVAIPLFVFMGVMLERSKIAESLLETIGLIFGRMNGGLGLAVVIVGTLLAASTGVVGATVVTLGLLSLPAMLRAGYDPKLATGVICATGTLGQIIPPSTVLILLADILQGANAQAQRAKGNFAPDPVSVAELFAGALIPGLMLVALYATFVLGMAIFNKKSCPALVEEGEYPKDMVKRVFSALVPPMLLIFAVLGSILGGIATTSESAAIGAIGAMMLAAQRRMLTLSILKSAMRSTLQISAMIFMIMIGASLFSLVFRVFGSETLVEHFLHNLPGGTFTAMLIVMVVIFLLGFVLDFIEIMFLVLPTVAPIMLMHDISPIWFGIMVAVNLQTSFLTPPAGFSLFYLRSVAPRRVRTSQIYWGAMPFVGLQLIGLGLLWYFPALTTWLPDVLF